MYVSLTLAPSIYSVLPTILQKLGPEHSLVPPRILSLILIGHDILALILQIAGYAAALPATRGDRGFVPINAAGIHVVTAGVAIQLAAMLAAALIFIAAAARARKAQALYGYTTFHKELGYVPLSPLFLAAAAAVPAVCALLLGRCAYRVAALEGGLGGRVSRDQGMFVGLEGIFVMLALVAGSLCNPGVFLWTGRQDAADENAPFVEQGSNVDELSRVYKEQDRTLARNSSTRVMVI
jgi:hypothetical protein